MTSNEILVGQELEVVFNDPPSKLADLIKGVWLPVKIVAEYPRFFVAEVLPHYNPNGNWGMSKPYKVTLDKFGIGVGEVKVRDGWS